nr:ATP-binding protein [uncultured Desulfobacter sp.]
MKKEYLIIPLVFVLISVVVAGYNVHVIVDVQKKHIFEMLSHQVDISARNLQGFADEFEEDVQYALTTIPFHDLLVRDAPDYDLTNQVRRFYSRYQHILSSIQVFNRSISRELYNSQGNYFFISELRENEFPRHVVDGIVYRLEKDTLHFLRDIRHDGKKVGAIEIRMDFPRIIYHELRKSNISREFWPWCVDKAGRILSFLVHQRAVPASKRQVDGIKTIVDDIGDNYLGEQVHSIALKGERHQVFSAYYPIRIFGQQVGVVLSVGEDVWLAGVKTKMAAVIASFLLIIVFVSVVFLFILWQRMAAELKLKKSEAKVTKIFQNIQAGVLIIDKKRHTIEFANGLAAGMAGTAVSDLIGKPCDQLFCPDENQRSPLSDNGGQIQATERTLLTVDGERRNILKTVIPLEYEGRESLLETFVDITELKKQTARANALAEKAEAASRAKSEFLANMSHEFRTPMNHIIGMSQLALDTRPTCEQQDYLEKISEAAESLMVLLNSVLDYAGIDTGKMHLKKAGFQLSALMRQVKDHILSKFPVQKQLNLRFDIDSKIPDGLMGDGPKLQQVLRLLAENAVKFTDTGEVVIKVSLEEQSAQAVRLKFSVKDTGIGIFEEQMDTLFDAFTQADTSNTRKYGGAGLGLAISKRLVELMQGTLSVKSTPGKGSEFFFSVAFDVDHSSINQKVPDLAMVDLVDSEQKETGQTPASLPVLDLREALGRMGGDQRLLERVLGKFQQNYSHEMETLDRLLMDGDRVAAARLVHKLKGAVSVIGAPDLTKTIVALEAALNDGETELGHHLAAVSSGMARVRSEISHLLEHSASDGGDAAVVPIDVNKSLPLVKALERYLKESDLEAMEKLDEIKTVLNGTSVSGALEHMAAQLQQYDFEGALSGYYEVLSMIER